MRILGSIRPRVAAAVAAAVLALPLAVLATNTDWTADTELQVGAHRLIILSGSASDSLSVDSSASTFTVTVSNTDTFTVRYPSPNAGTLNNDGGLSACNNVGGNNDVAVTAPSGGSVTVTFAPSSTPCVAGGGGSTTPTVILSQPNGGETFSGGSSTQVFWGTGGSGIQTIRISLSLDSGATFSLIADNEANDGSYAWSVPSTSTTTARMKVEALGTGSAILASDTSDANFSITVPSSGGGGGGGGTVTPPPPPPPPADAKVLPKITSFSPLSGAVGSAVTVTGADFGSDVSVSFGGTGAGDIAFASSTSIKVIVPAGAVTGKISVTNSDGTATSTDTFTVTPGTAPEESALRVKVLSPNGGESYPTSAAMTMRWILRYSAASSASTVVTTPYLSVDGGATWNAIGDALVRPDGTYTFQLTVPVTPTARIRVVAVDEFGDMASDDSDADFTVATAGSAPIVPTYPPGSFDAVPLTDEEIKAPDDDPNASGGSGYSAGGATAATPTIDVDKNLIPPPPDVKLPCIGGTLIKVRTNSAVYYCGKNGRRFVFPNEKIYFTWFANFNAVATVSDAAMSAIPIGGNITYKPGVKMVKLQTDPKVYAIARDGLLRWVKDEAVAVKLYGPTWNQKIDDVPDSFFFNYKIGPELAISPTTGELEIIVK